ncbi:MAG: hypothetical protein EZS28_002776 [Streblomastix strix]|uniref:Uncharacterized protein n=1 Tax=Streblomastix strix TaxID=222440 RepID=A0A5J4X361_9EUKA|nr:MAG: hypothetical protein EZS28_002776 [Streblomastix strix]
MTQASDQIARALFTHFCDGAGPNATPIQPLADYRDANGNDFNVYTCDREITVTDADAGPALMTLLMQEIQFFIVGFMELLTERNALATDFWANPITQLKIRTYKARILHASEVTRHAEYKLMILSIQHVLEGNRKETLIDIVGVRAALLRFAQKSTCI